MPLLTILMTLAASMLSAATVPPGGSFLDRTLAVQRAIDACRRGNSVEFAAGTYLISGLRLKSDCSYRGKPGKSILRLKAKNAFVFDLSERSHIQISGLVFDANSLGGAIIAQGYAPVRDIHVVDCEFRNVVAASTYPANLAVFSSWGVIDSEFVNNIFTDVSGGVSLTTVQNVTIAGNKFHNVTQSDAVFIAPNPVSFPSGDRLTIAGNSGDGLAKMGIEIFRPDPPNGSRLVAPVVENNSFSRFTASNGEGMGLSITHGDGAIIRNNRVDNSTGIHQGNGIGIEVIVKNAQVTANTIDRGMGYGIAVQGTPGSLISLNRIMGMGQDGILFACDNGRHRCDSSGSVVEQNEIVNARVNGIRADNNWAESRVENNTIMRSGGYWKGDSAVAFTGVRMAPASRSVTIRGNTITQTAQHPPGGFDFHGIEMNPDVPDAVIVDNTFRSLSGKALGAGLSGTAGKARNWRVAQNRFINLARGQ